MLGPRLCQNRSLSLCPYQVSLFRINPVIRKHKNSNMLDLYFPQMLHPGLPCFHRLLESSCSDFGNIGLITICGTKRRKVFGSAAAGTIRERLLVVYMAISLRMAVMPVLAFFVSAFALSPGRAAMRVVASLRTSRVETTDSRSRSLACEFMTAL